MLPFLKHMAGEPKEFKLPSKCASHYKWCEKKDLTIQLSTWSRKQEEATQDCFKLYPKTQQLHLFYEVQKVCDTVYKTEAALLCLKSKVKSKV